MVTVYLFREMYAYSPIVEKADAVIESAVALTQEIHDGPFECYTGHGIWPN